MRILVLGGTGAMGVDLVKILAQRGEKITVTSRSARKSEFKNVNYIQGNANDTVFLKRLLCRQYDAVVDFMSYSTEEFEARRDLLLDMVGQYIFLSSSRVYASSEEPITEDSPRLLDVTMDKEYLKSDEYALAKARQENLLRESGKTNWTIVRPYITYSNQRLQLGVYEKELWLYRALHGRTVIFPKAIAEKYTTMTLGENVARGISMLIGNEKAYGETFHITIDKTIKWNDVLVVYQKVFREIMGREIKIKYVDDLQPIYEVMGNKYQVIYDRFFDRRFDNSKLKNVTEEYSFTLPEEGLEKCLKEFLSNPVFKRIGTPEFAVMDRLTKERTKLSEIPGVKHKIRYLVLRDFPNGVIFF